MTHKDIYKKFMIEYDKANITSSYPSLTHYEIATILDKAYLALIGQKITGNNPRRVGFEADVKSIEDIRLLETSVELGKSEDNLCASNEVSFDVPGNFIYYVISKMVVYNSITSTDNVLHTEAITQLVNHDLAQKFKNTDTNMPWIKIPVIYFEGGKLRLLYDSFKYKDDNIINLNLTYIKAPAKFTNDNDRDSSEKVDFELSDSMAEELINLAIAFATETVESPRLQTKLSTLQLES